MNSIIHPLHDHSELYTLPYIASLIAYVGKM